MGCPALNPDGGVGGRRLARRVGRRTVDLACLAGGLVIVSVPLGRLWAVADILAIFLVQAALGLVLAAALALWLRSWRRAAVAGVLLAVAVAWMLPIGSPLGRTSAPADAGLRLLVANLHGPSGIPPLPELRAWIEARDVDVVLLTEVSISMRAPLQALSAVFPYSADCAGERYCETLMLSRRPLHDAEYQVDARGGGKLLLADIDAGGQQRLTLALTHVLRPIPPGSPERNWRQSQFVASAAAGRRSLVLTGDFNAVPWGRVMAMFEQRLGVRGPALLQGTWPSWLPTPFRVHIDHVLVGCGVELRQVRTERFPRSDHLAVMATVRPGAAGACD